MMMKRIGTLAMACALSLSMAAAIPAMNVHAEFETTGIFTTECKTQVDGYAPAKNYKKAVDHVTDTLSKDVNASELKPSGVANVKVSVVSGSAKDNLMDNAVKPCVKEFVKKYFDVLAGKTASTDVRALAAIYYGNVTGDQAGDVTFKLEDKVDNTAIDGDRYAIVLHYTGNAADEDGVTAQFAKVSASGKLTAHFNTFGPFAIIATTEKSAQQLANTYSHAMGSDAANLTPAATTVTTTAAPVATAATPVATTATAAAPVAAPAPVATTATAATPVATTAAPVATTAAPAATTATTTQQGVQTTTPVTTVKSNEPIMVVR